MEDVGRLVEQSDTAPDGDEPRARQRDSLFMIAQLRLAGDDDWTDVRVRNLSAGGLMVDFARAIVPGAAVTLVMRNFGELTGTVAWCTRGRIGIALDEPIDPKRARQPSVKGTMTPDYVRPVIVTRGPRR